MCKFITPNTCSTVQFLHYLYKSQKLFKKYYKYLQDDFSQIDNLYELIKNVYPHFWFVTDTKNKYKGFVFLDNFTGNDKIHYSAELTTCFDKSAWGYYIRYCAKIFLKKCFDNLNLQKIKAQIYPENHRVKQLLKDVGFKYEATLKNETLRLNKAQDIEVYGLYKNYYYKN